MTDLTTLSNDEFVASFRDHFAEAHRRLESTGYVRAKDRLNVAHAHLDKVGKQLAKDGQVSALSVGGDKPEDPPPSPPGAP